MLVEYYINYVKVKNKKNTHSYSAPRQPDIFTAIINYFKLFKIYYYNKNLKFSKFNRKNKKNSLSLKY